jgi:hypothetical protein
VAQSVGSEFKPLYHKKRKRKKKKKIKPEYEQDSTSKYQEIRQTEHSKGHYANAISKN